MKWVTLSEELFVTRGIPETPQIFILRKRKTNVLNWDPVEGSEWSRPSHCLFSPPIIVSAIIRCDDIATIGANAGGGFCFSWMNECIIIIIERCQKTWRKRSIRDTYRTLRKVSKTKYIIANQKSSKSAAAGMDSSSSSLPWTDMIVGGRGSPYAMSTTCWFNLIWTLIYPVRRRNTRPKAGDSGDTWI